MEACSGNQRSQTALFCQPHTVHTGPAGMARTDHKTMQCGAMSRTCNRSIIDNRRNFLKKYPLHFHRYFLSLPRVGFSHQLLIKFVILLWYPASLINLFAFSILCSMGFSMPSVFPASSPGKPVGTFGGTTPDAIPSSRLP